MSVNLIVNGTSYPFPVTGDETWGANVTNWATAVTSSMLQKTGGLFTLSADVDFGASFGLVSMYLKSRSANIAVAGVIRLASQDKISFRNNANSADLPLTTDASDNLLYNGVPIATSGGITPVAAGGTGFSSYTIGDTLYASAAAAFTKLGIGAVNTVNVSTGSAPSWALLVNANIAGAAAIVYSKLSLTNSIVNADIASAAAIVYSKLSLTNSVVNADIASAAAIVYSKLSLANSILNADIAAAAGINLSKTDRLFNLEAIFTQISTPSNPSAGLNKIYPKSDGFFYSLDSTGAERKIGSGAGSINYIQANPDAESGTTGWATYANAAGATPVTGTGGAPSHITLTSSASSPLRGLKSFLMSNSGSTSAQGEGVSFDFTIDPADQSKVLAFTFDYGVASGTFVSGNLSDVRAFIYDKTNAVLIPVSPSTIQGGGTTNFFSFKGIFQTANNSTSYRLILHVATTATSAYGLKFDNVFVGPQAVQYGAPISDWQSFTPTGSWVANTTYTGVYRRVGGNMEVQVKIALSGAPTSASLTVNMPSGFTIDPTRFASGAASQDDRAVGLGSGIHGGGSVGSFQALYDSVSAVLITYQANVTGGILAVSQAAPFTWANTDVLIVYFSVPITGWSSTVLMSNDTDTRVVAMSVPPSSGTLTTTLANNIVWGSATLDTHGGFSGGTYTIPVSGIYKIYGQAGAGSAGTFGSQINVAKNGVAQSPSFLGPPNGVNSTLTTFEYLGKFVAGDTVQVWGAVSTGTQSVSANGVWNLERLTGPSAIAATETVAARYTAASSAAVPTAVGTTFNFLTKDYDSHGAVTVGAGWIFTAPIAGKYIVTISAGVNCSVVAGFNVAIYKNGVAFNLQLSSQFVSGNFNSNLQLTDDMNLLPGDTVSAQFYTGGQAATFNSTQQIAIRRVGN